METFKIKSDRFIKHMMFVMPEHWPEIDEYDFEIDEEIMMDIDDEDY